MEIKTKYQYTYFIYPYIIKEKNFEKYLEKILHNKDFHLKDFEREKDWDLYTYFLPKIRNYMFWNFDYNKAKLNKLEEFDPKIQATILAKYPCIIFEYSIKKDIQGKTQKKDGIFFNINKIELICFNSGICFFCIKTALDNGATFEDVCNFNYKFRDINASETRLKEFENIKIQADIFKDEKAITDLIKETTGNKIEAKRLNIDTENFITYSYVCVGQEYWEDESNEEILNKEFYRFANIQSADSSANYNFKEPNFELKKSKYYMLGCSKKGTVLITSDIETSNFTKLPHKFENEYLYNYIFELYKKIYLNKINRDFELEERFIKTKNQFISFTKNVWIEEITNDDVGNSLIEIWNEKLGFKQIYLETKQKYDVIYKNVNVEKTAKSNKWIVVMLTILILVNIVNCAMMIGR